MTFTMKLEGMADLEREIEKRLKEIGGPMTEKFLTVALGEVAAHTAPYVPVDTSNLINSEWRRVYAVPSGWTGEIGYNATRENREVAKAGGTPSVSHTTGDDYAMITHEGGPKNWQKGGASDKYLERGLEDFIRDSLDATIKAAYR